MNDEEQVTRSLLDRACDEAGITSSDATVVRLGENAIFRLRDRMIVRIARAGQTDAARREVAVAQWMERTGIPAVRIAHVANQPIDIDGRAVTFWHELPPHKHGTPTELARALRRLHDAPLPVDVDLGAIQPFVRLVDRIDRASTLSKADRSWLRGWLAELEQRWGQHPSGLPECVVHGDAWAGNVVSTTTGQVVFLDLERTSIGPPEWDLVHTAIKHSSFGWITAEEYSAFSRAYDHDVTQWVGFELFRDIREFRMTCMAAQVAAGNPGATDQAAHRVKCLQGKCGPRPWAGWSTLP